MNYITVVRAKLKGSPQEAQVAHDATVEQLSAMNRPMGADWAQASLEPTGPNAIPGDRYVEQSGRLTEINE